MYKTESIKAKQSDDLSMHIFI